MSSVSLFLIVNRKANKFIMANIAYNWVKVLRNNTQTSSSTLGFFTHEGAKPVFCLGSSEGFRRCLKTSHAFFRHLSISLLTNSRIEELGNVLEVAFEALALSRYKSFKYHLYGPKGLKSTMANYQIMYGKLFERWEVHELCNSSEGIDLMEKFLAYPILMESEDLKDPVNLSYYIKSYSKRHDANFLFLSTPNTSYLPGLLKNDFLKDFALGSESVPSIVYHSAPYEVLVHSDYTQFMEKYWPNSNHLLDCPVLLNDSHPRKKSNYITNLYSTCCPGIFPEMPTSSEDSNSIILKERLMKRLEKLKVRNVEVDEKITLGSKSSSNVSPTPLASFKITPNDKLFKATLNKYISNSSKLQEKRQLCAVAPTTKKFKNEPYFLFLGTSAQVSTIERNVSSIYINIPGDQLVSANKPLESEERLVKSHGIMLDCGGGTYGQLFDHLPNPAMLRALLAHLRVLCISHQHADHVNGFAKILLEADKSLRYFVSNPSKEAVWDKYPLFIVVPSLLKSLIKNAVFSMNLAYPERIRVINSNLINPDPFIHYQLDPIHPNTPVKHLDEATIKEMVKDIYKNASGNERELLNFAKEVLRLEHLHTFETFHMDLSRAVLLKGDNWKVVYTGDTAPCETTINFARNADLLIHECSYLTNKSAVLAKHTNLPKLIKLEREIQSWRTVLTHISALHEQYDRKRLSMPSNFILAHDHLRFRLADAEWIPQVISLLDIISL